MLISLFKLDHHEASSRLPPRQKNFNTIKNQVRSYNSSFQTPGYMQPEYISEFHMYLCPADADATHDHQFGTPRLAGRSQSFGQSQV